MALSRCIVSLATEDKQYPAALRRLGQSLARSRFNGKFRSWPPGTFPADAPPQTVSPYAFKPFCLVEAQRLGFDVLLWLDSSCVPVREIDSILRRIQRDGYVLFRNSNWRVGQWCSDVGIEALGIDREEAMRWPEVNAAAIGLNLNDPTAAEFLRRWHEEADEGTAFRGVKEPLLSEEDFQAVKWNHAHRVSADPRVRGHRCDQTVAGVLAARLGMVLDRNGLRDYSTRHRRIGLRTRIVVDRDAAQPSPPLRSLDQVLRDRYIGLIVDPPHWRSAPGRLLRGTLRAKDDSGRALRRLKR